MKTFLTILITTVIVGAVAVGVIYKSSGGGSGGPETVVRIESAQRGSLVESVSAPGQVQPKTKVSISGRVAARIVELPYKEGEVVTKGNPATQPAVAPSVLLRLDSKDLEALLRATQARYDAQASQITVSEARIGSQEQQITSSRVQLADAQRDLKRQTELLATKDVSQSTVDTAQAKYDQLTAELASLVQSVEADRVNLTVLRHQLDAADAEIARARDSLSYTTITSPIDGVVTKINSQVGELVVIGTMNNPGTVIMEVADLDTMIVNARVDEGSISQLKVGQRVVVRTQAYTKETFEGVVSAVALALTEEKDNSRYYKCEVLLKTEGRRIFSGLTADVEVETARHENVLTIPSQAVLGRAVDELPQTLRDKPEVDKSKSLVTVVYRMIDGKAVVTPVRVGASDVTRTVIESGLSEGEPVVVGPYKELEKLVNDQKIKDEKTVTTQPSKS